MKRELSSTVEDIKKRKMIEKFLTLGADPEFELIHSGRVISASRVIDGGTDSKIGVDGAGYQVEFRPEPSISPRCFVNNFTELLREFKGRYIYYKLSSQGDTYPLGGHIHIGSFDREVINILQINAEEIIGAIDDFLGFLVELSGKARGSYRERQAWRRQDWGVEYRTLPSAVFSHPIFLKIITKAIKSIVAKFIKRGYLKYDKTDKDYVVICNLNRTEIDFLSKAYKNRLGCETETDVLTNYGIKKSRNYYKVEIGFSDEWGFEREMWRNILREQLKSIATSKKVNIIVNLFGFKEERGLVTNLELNNFAGVKKIEGWDLFSWDGNNVKVNLGIPRAFRKVELSFENYNEYKKIICKFAESLRENLKEILKKKEV